MYQTTFFINIITGDVMTKIIHLLNPNQKMKLELILEGLDKIRIEYSKGNTETDKLIEIHRIIKEIKDYVPNHKTTFSI